MKKDELIEELRDVKLMLRELEDKVRYNEKKQATEEYILMCIRKISKLIINLEYSKTENI